MAEMLFGFLNLITNVVDCKWSGGRGLDWSAGPLPYIQILDDVMSSKILLPPFHLFSFTFNTIH